MSEYNRYLLVSILHQFLKRIFKFNYYPNQMNVNNSEITRSNSKKPSNKCTVKKRSCFSLKKKKRSWFPNTRQYKHFGILKYNISKTLGYDLYVKMT